MLYQAVKFQYAKEIPAEAADGTFEGLASTYGNRDWGGDVVAPGAFTKTIRELKGIVPILHHHRGENLIGDGKVADSEKGLNLVGSLAIEFSERAREVYGFMKRGILKGLSIGYDIVKQEIVTPKAPGEVPSRILKEIKLWEVSVVLWPMNPAAGISRVKDGTAPVVVCMGAKARAPIGAIVLADRVRLYVKDGAVLVFGDDDAALAEKLGQWVTPPMVAMLEMLQGAVEPLTHSTTRTVDGLEPEILHSLRSMQAEMTAALRGIS